MKGINYRNLHYYGYSYNFKYADCACKASEKAHFMPGGLLQNRQNPTSDLVIDTASQTLGSRLHTNRCFLPRKFKDPNAPQYYVMRIFPFYLRRMSRHL